MDILGELEYSFLLLPSLFLLGTEVGVKLVDLGLLLGQFLAQLVHLLHLLLEDLLQVEQLVFQVLYLLLLRLQTGAHLSGAVRQHVLALLQILYLEFVLVQVSFALFELVHDLLALLLEHLDLLHLLLQLLLDLLLALLGVNHLAFLQLSVVLQQLLLGLLVLLDLLKLGPVLFQLGLVLLVFLLDFEDLVLVLVLLLVELGLVYVLQTVGRLLGVLVLVLHLEQVVLELAQQFVDGFLVLLGELGDLALVVLDHFKPFLFQLEVVGVFDVELLLVDLLQVLHGVEVVQLHLLHGFEVLPVLHVLLPLQVLVALVQVLDVQVLLALDFGVLVLVLLLGLEQLLLNFLLVDIKVVLQLLLLLLPLLHLVLLHQHDVRKGFIYDAVHHIVQLLLFIGHGEGALKAFRGDELLTDLEHEDTAVGAGREEVPVVWTQDDLGYFPSMGGDRVQDAIIEGEGEDVQVALVRACDEPRDLGLVGLHIGDLRELAIVQGVAVLDSTPRVKYLQVRLVAISARDS